MEQKKAIELLKELIVAGRKIDSFNDGQRERWQLDCRAVLERVFGSDSRQLREYMGVHWTPRVISQDQDKNREYKEVARRNGLRRSMTILEASLNEVEQFWELDQAGRSIDPFRVIERLCNRFHACVRQLRDRHDNRPTLDVNDEYDVQDLIHAMLLLDFDDVRPEEWTPSYAGAAARMDFLLKREKIVLEVKRTRKGLNAKEIGEQLIVDCQRYKGHPDCKMLVCFVYDPEGFVANPRGVETDLSTAGGEMPVKVFVRP